MQNLLLQLWDIIHYNVGHYSYYVERTVVQRGAQYIHYHTYMLNDSTVSLVLYTYSSELMSVVGIFRHLRRAHLTIQRGALYISTALDIIPYYVGFNYTCSSMTTWGSLNYERVSFINVGRYYKLSYIHERGASARRLNNLRHEFN